MNTDEDRSEDGPLGRAARNKDVDEGRNEDKGDAHGKARKADSSEEVSTGNRHERAQMGPVEKSLELAAEKAENNVGTMALICLTMALLISFRFMNFPVVRP